MDAQQSEPNTAAAAESAQSEQRRRAQPESYARRGLCPKWVRPSTGGLGGCEMAGPESNPCRRAILAGAKGFPIPLVRFVAPLTAHPKTAAPARGSLGGSRGAEAAVPVRGCIAARQQSLTRRPRPVPLVSSGWPGPPAWTGICRTPAQQLELNTAAVAESAQSVQRRRAQPESNARRGLCPKWVRPNIGGLGGLGMAGYRGMPDRHQSFPRRVRESRAISLCPRIT
jgi:hypothetical protein